MYVYQGHVACFFNGSFGTETDICKHFFVVVSEANVVDHVLEGQTASTSHHHQSPKKKDVEISITVPGAKKKKKGW